MLYKTEHTFQSAAEKWLISITPQIKISTANKYRNLLDSYLYPKLGTIKIRHLTQECIEAHCNDLLLNGGKKGIGLAPKTVADTLSVVRSVLKFAARTEPFILCDGKDIRIKQQTKQMRVLSRYEQEQLCKYLHAQPNKYNIGILVCLFTGMRVGEICALQWSDISVSDQVIHIQRTMQRIQNRGCENPKTKILISSPKSACSIRTIPIPEELLQIILHHRTCNSGFFLTNSVNHFVEPRTMQNHFKRALRASNVSDANFHALRHTFATRCVEVGFDEKSLSEILGHANVNITMNRYVHPSLELKKQNMQRLSELFFVE